MSTRRQGSATPSLEPSLAGGLHQRLFRSHMTVAAIGLITLLIVSLFVLQLRQNVHRLARLHGPTAHASLQALQGVQRSLAGLRGWMASNDPHFAAERSAAWRDDIEPAILQLEKLGVEWEDAQIRVRLDEIKDHLHKLKREQWWIEDVAQTPGNEPARVRLSQEADPIADELFETITAMMEIERARKAGASGTTLFSAMADVRGQTTHAHLILTGFVLSGSEPEITNFENATGIAKRRLTDIETQVSALTPDQSNLFQKLKLGFRAYETIAQDVVLARQRPDWNVAQHRLRTRAAPQANKALLLLSSLSDDKSASMAREATRMISLSNWAMGLAMALIGAMVLAAMVVSRRNVKQLAHPIAMLSHATKEILLDQPHADLPVTSDDELGQLTTSFNTMRNQMDTAFAQIRQSEQLNRKMMEAAPSGMVLSRRDGTIIFVNSVMLDMFGYEKGELDGQKVEIFLPGALRSGHVGLRDDYAQQPTTRVMGSGRDLSAMRKDGSTFPVEVGLNPVETADGFCVLASLVDITERNRHEEQLEKYAKVLRTSNAALKRSNVELEQFAYVASHDLQEPLRKIQAFGNLLSGHKDKLDEDGQHCIERMLDAAGRMQVLIDDLLQLSRLTRNAKPFVPVNLSELYGDVILDLEARIEENAGKVSCTKDLPTLNADPTQMRQLFQNLIGNALKYNRPDVPPRVTIDVRHPTPEEAPEGSDPTAFWRFTFEDNGIGFDEKYADQIFQPFRRLFGRGQYEGTGIGLAICRKISERHGGAIYAEGRPGEGATFIVTLPINQKEAVD